ncbi:hypothetical protein LZC95_43340 [Pendulispora brunnea]|uniref:HEAT repeat domain-containing protein n=1 Tax=Pendulispora brunnea TaxID=2905690 RepID=A0ABZ2KA85_9BACT
MTRTSEARSSVNITSLVMDLARDVEYAWQQADYDNVELAVIADRALVEHALHESISWMDIVRWVNIEPNLPKQHNIEATFGQPPVTLYEGRRFYIEALFWLDGSPAVHSHSFAGAFQVFEGTSLHSVYEFEERQRVNADFRIGDMRCTKAEYLHRGDVRRILPGDEFIHSTFHLDVPSVSLVVRTRHSTPRDSSGDRQFTFFRPGMARASHFQDDAVTRRCQLLKMLGMLGHDDYDAELLRLVEADDFESMIRYLEVDLELRRDIESIAAILSRVGTKHGKKTRLLLHAILNSAREQTICGLRKTVQDARLRRFLAVAMVAWDRKSALALLEEGFPNESPIDVTVECAMRLAKDHRDLSGVRLASDDAGILREILSDNPSNELIDRQQVAAIRSRLLFPSVMAVFVNP